MGVFIVILGYSDGILGYFDGIWGILVVLRWERRLWLPFGGVSGFTFGVAVGWGVSVPPDYETLRLAGLVLAIAMFVLGVLVALSE